MSTITDDDKFYILDWSDIEYAVGNFVNEHYELTGEHLDADDTIIIGLTRGGLTPAVMLSHATGCPMHALDYSSNRGNGDQKRPNDAFPVDLIRRYSTILIVDEIVDTGHTLNDLTTEIEELATKYAHDHPVNIITFAVVYKDIPDGAYEPTYYHIRIDKSAAHLWVVYPWERNEYVYDFEEE
jgi:hypothetical protein